MKKIFTLFSALMLLLWQQTAMAANATVTVGPNNSNTFSPAAVSIKAGEMVTWIWSSGVHTIQSDSSPAQWGIASSDASHTSFSHVFPAVGTYPYHCTIHGVSMAGVVTVTAATTGISENQASKLSLNIFPNPAQNKVNLTLTNATDRNYEVRFTNAIGKMVKTVAPSELKNAAEGIELDLSALPSGIYFYTLWNNDKMLETKRIVISR